MIHIADTKVERRYGDFFIRQIHKFEEVSQNFSWPDHIALGPVVQRLIGTYLGIVFIFIHMFFSTPLGDQEYSSSAVKANSWDTIWKLKLQNYKEKVVKDLLQSYVFNEVSDLSMQLLYSSEKTELCGLKLHKKHSFRLDYSKL